MNFHIKLPKLIFSLFVLITLGSTQNLQAQNLPELLKNINTNNEGSADSSADNFIEYGEVILFGADDGINGEELWRSDGTVDGTYMVKDINPGPDDSDIEYMTLSNGTVFFAATNGTNGTELWKTDGTANGTVMVKDISVGVTGGVPRHLVDLNNTLYFQAYDVTNNQELWKSDGTEGGTVLVKDINPGGTGSGILQIIKFGNELFFGANDGTNGLELWKSDGTTDGTVLVKNIYTGATGSSAQMFYVYNDILIFIADDGSGIELWKSDGTGLGTVRVKDINPGSGGSTPTLFINVNNVLYFKASDGSNGSELWKSDGTEGGTVLVKDINPGSGGSSISSIVDLNGVAYFSANDGTDGSELWKSDGTTEGTVLVKDIYTGGTGSDPYIDFVSSTTLYFSADDGVNGTELWKSDGTTEGTFLAYDFYEGSNNSWVSIRAAFDDVLFLTADDGVVGNELWIMNSGNEINSLNEITNWQELRNMRFGLGADYILMNDLDEDSFGYDTYASSLANSGAGWNPVGSSGTPFEGSFDGNDYTISDLFINRPTSDYIGLFGVTLNAEISDLGLIDVDIIGGDTVGGLVGDNGSGSLISNSYTTGSVIGADPYGQAIGGLVGYNQADIENSYSEANVDGNFYIGGLVGDNYGPISNSYASGSVTGDEDVGGLVGDNNDGGIISNSYASGSVTGNEWVGGLAGYNYEGGIISKTYSIGLITSEGESVGGLVGDDGGGTIVDSFWDTETSGIADGLYGTGKTTAEMKSIANYNNLETVGLDEVWNIVLLADFENEIWFIEEGIGYPRLGWEYIQEEEENPEEPEDPEEEEQPVVVRRSSRSSGTSVKTRVNNLISINKLDAALDLVTDFPNAFKLPADKNWNKCELMNFLITEDAVNDRALIILKENLSLCTSANNISSVVSPVNNSTTVIFSRDLELNMVGEDVRQLQIFLNNNGFRLAETGPGSLGNETTTFGPITRQALIRFQKENNINPAVGYFGPITRGVVNLLKK